MPTFAERVQALPQELYDEILHLTFTKASNIIHVDGAYRPSTVIQVSRATRSKLAESYYGNGSIFYISEHNIAKWLRALSQSHYQLLDEVRMTHKTIHKEKVGPSESSFRKLAMRLGFEHFKICNRIETAPIHQNRALLDNGDRTMTKKGVHLQVVFGQPEGKVWISHQFLGRLRKMRDRDFGARSVISEEDLHKILDVEHERQRQGRSDRPGLTNTELDYCYG